jgi:hypothetical protein
MAHEPAVHDGHPPACGNLGQQGLGFVRSRGVAHLEAERSQIALKR